MAAKNNTEVSIGGKVYTLCGYENEEYLQRVALYINNKLDELKKSEGYRKQSADVREMLMYLNIADDYFKAKKSADSLENQTETKDKEVYDLKHELIAAQIKQEATQKEVATLKEEIESYKNTIKQLQDELSDLRK